MKMTASPSTHSACHFSGKATNSSKDIGMRKSRSVGRSSRARVWVAIGWAPASNRGPAGSSTCPKAGKKQLSGELIATAVVASSLDDTASLAIIDGDDRGASQVPNL